MTYLATWTAVALAQLGQVVAAATDPANARQEGAWVDYALRRMPRDMGEAGSNAFREWYLDTLGVYFHVDEAAGRVRVLSCGLARRH
jgi:hypothetical protein